MTPPLLRPPQPHSSVQAIVDRMDYNHEDSLQWEASATKVALATATLASRTADEERWTIL